MAAGRISFGGHNNVLGVEAMNKLPPLKPMTETDKNRLSEMIADLRMKWETKAMFDDFYDKAKHVFRKQIKDTAARREALTRVKAKQQEILDRW